MSVIESLKVEGNIPCPTPGSGKPPLPEARRKSIYDPSKPVKLKKDLWDKNYNKEEELKNILLQAKASPLVGPTLIAKRMGYMNKIKQLNDGMYKHHNGVDIKMKTKSEAKVFSLEGKNLNSSSMVEDNSTEQQKEKINEDEDEMQVEKTAMNIGSKSCINSAKSNKSYHSMARSVRSDSGAGKTLVLPSLTIGADRHKTRGEYVGQGSSAEILGLANPDYVKGEGEEYEFRFNTPRKFRFRNEHREIKSPDTTGNYKSLSLSDLKACLYVNHSQDRSPHQDLIVQNYKEQLKHKKNGLKVNPYKMLKDKSKNRHYSGVSPRYEFNSVESYLKYNKTRNHSESEATETRLHHEQTSLSDTIVLKMMSELNNPVVHKQSKQELLRINNQFLNTYERPLLSKRHTMYENSPAKEDRPVLQHIVYIPSDQNGKVRLIKS